MISVLVLKSLEVLSGSERFPPLNVMILLISEFPERYTSLPAQNRQIDEGNSVGTTSASKFCHPFWDNKLFMNLVSKTYYTIANHFLYFKLQPALFSCVMISY